MKFDLYIDGPETHEDYVLPAFSVPIFHYKISNWRGKKENLLKIYNSRIKQKKKFKVSEGKENSLDVETDFHFNYDNSSDQYSNQIEKILQDELDAFAEDSGLEIEVHNCWFEKAEKHKFHPCHNHGSTGYSAVCFINFDPKYHTPTVFINPITADDDISNFIPPKVREGSLIFFPSFLYHYTSPNLSDIDRIILSFNLGTSVPFQKFEDDEHDTEYFTDNV
jgi:hypothetical protein